MMDNKVVIINADDFGMSHSVNAAISLLLRDKLITDTTLMANGEAFDEAVCLCKNNPYFANHVGIHLNLTEGKPLTKKLLSFPKFVNLNGLFTNYFRKKKSFLTPLKRKEKKALYFEIKEQIKRIKESGIAISHLDSHQHIHYNGKLLKIIVKVCKEEDISIIRGFKNLHPSFKNKMYSRIFNRILRKNNIRTADYFGNALEYKGLNNGVSEIMVHPDYDDNSNVINRIKRISLDNKIQNIGNAFNDDMSFLNKEKYVLSSFEDFGKENQ